MTFNLSKEEFMLMQKFIDEHSGIHIGPDKAYLIESRLSKLVEEAGLKNFFAFYRRLENNRDLVQKVIDAITTNETQWFRDKSPWQILVKVLLPLYIKEIREDKRSTVKIWSAACSSGQEPYSIAMCIQRYLNELKINDVSMANFNIIATDISKTILEAAMAGSYDRISVERGLAGEYLHSFFNKTDNHWIIKDSIKKIIDFKEFNLVGHACPPGQFDIIFCRYVMIYFSESSKVKLLKKIVASLKSGGVMFLGNSEIMTGESEIFEKVKHEEGIYYMVRR